MCNLSQGIYNDGKADGRAEGRSEGAISKAVDVVKNLLAKGFPLEESLEHFGEFPKAAVNPICETAYGYEYCDC